MLSLKQQVSYPELSFHDVALLVLSEGKRDKSVHKRMCWTRGLILRIISILRKQATVKGWIHYSNFVKMYLQYLSHVMRKQSFCICNCEADQHLCFRYIDTTIPLLSTSEISSL